MIHIEGMGLLGSLLALNLHERDQPFTWHDSASPITAWKACTGMVYPAGDDRSMEGLRGWQSWLTEGWLPYLRAEPVRYVYAHKNPPHEGKYRAEFDLGDMRVAPTQPGAVGVNVPAIVTSTQLKFQASRYTACPSDATTVVRAHGFNERLGSYMWGWSARVGLDVPDDLKAACDGMRPAFYSRKDRFQIVYAYPIPGEEGWWAGSAIISQKTPHSLDIAKHFARWSSAWAELWPRVPVTHVGEQREGWRPRPAVEVDDAHLVERQGNVITFPPLWHSGVRWAPLVINRALEMLT